MEVGGNRPLLFDDMMKSGAVPRDAYQFEMAPGEIYQEFPDFAAYEAARKATPNAENVSVAEVTTPIPTAEGGEKSAIAAAEEKAAAKANQTADQSTPEERLKEYFESDDEMAKQLKAGLAVLLGRTDGVASLALDRLPRVGRSAIEGIMAELNVERADVERYVEENIAPAEPKRLTGKEAVALVEPAKKPKKAPKKKAVPEAAAPEPVVPRDKTADELYAEATALAEQREKTKDKAKLTAINEQIDAIMAKVRALNRYRVDEGLTGGLESRDATAQKVPTAAGNPAGNRTATTGGQRASESWALLSRGGLRTSSQATRRETKEETRARVARNRNVAEQQHKVLRQWASENGLLLDADEFEKRVDYDISGAEHDVYFDPSDNRWYKRAAVGNNFAPVMHSGYDEYFARLLLHNKLFPNTPVRLEGFIEQPARLVKGVPTAARLLPVISQASVHGSPTTEAEVDARMAKLGYRKVGPYDYENADGLRVEDLHEENVVKVGDRLEVIIDPVIYARPELADAMLARERSDSVAKTVSRREQFTALLNRLGRAGVNIEVVRGAALGRENARIQGMGAESLITLAVADATDASLKNVVQLMHEVGHREVDISAPLGSSSREALSRAVERTFAQVEDGSLITAAKNANWAGACRWGQSACPRCRSPPETTDGRESRRKTVPARLPQRGQLLPPRVPFGQSFAEIFNAG